MGHLPENRLMIPTKISQGHDDRCAVQRAFFALLWTCRLGEQRAP